MAMMPRCLVRTSAGRSVFRVWTTSHSPTDSRAMLASMGGWAVHLGNVGLPRGDPGRGGNMILAQLSDPHIVAAGKLFRCPMQGTAPDAERARLEFDTAPYLARAVASLNALVPRPDVTVVTGDLVDHGEPDEYEQLRHLLAPLSMPVFVIPGNHDAREPLREAFRDARYLPAEGYLQFAIEDYPVTACRARHARLR